MAHNIIRDGLITALDIGTSKVCCMMARTKMKGMARIIGQGICRSKGMKNGSITSLKELEYAIRRAVGQAEQSAGESASPVLVSITSPSLYSQMIESTIQLSYHSVGKFDVDRLLKKACGMFNNKDDKIIHRFPLSYGINGDFDKIDPRGMRGEVLGVRLNMVMADSIAVCNVSSVVENCNLELAGLVASPYASGLSCLVDDEKEVGCILIDIGAGTTGISVFLNGQMVYLSVIPVGGNHITNDIACGLTTSVKDAEKIKNLYGCLIPSSMDRRENLEVPLVGEGEGNEVLEVNRERLIEIIMPRVEEMFELIKNRLIADGFFSLPSRRVVITGGTSQLQGIREIAEFMLDKQVRIGKPQNVFNIPQGMDTASFATCAGLLRFATNTRPEEKNTEMRIKTEKFGRVGKWFLQSF